MEYRDNTVVIEVKCGQIVLEAGKYTIHEFCVTEGQDPDHHIKAGLKTPFDKSGSMTFEIGRKGSEKTANWFNNKFTPAQTTFNHSADKLNFAFIGTLELTLSNATFKDGKETFIFNNVGIAQGHTLTSNNWWFASQNGKQANDNSIECTTKTASTEITLRFKRGSSSNINRDQAVNEIFIMEMTSTTKK